MKRNPRALHNGVFFGDTHIGCQLGLMHPSGAHLDEGGTMKPSALQRKVWSWWREFWDEFVPKATDGKPFFVVHMGDAIDGVHHGSTHQWASSLEMQARHAEKILAPIVEACDGYYYHLRGTEAHVGPSSVEDDKLARKIGALPNREGQYARYDLWKQIGPRLIHAAHHIGTAGSTAYESSAALRELIEGLIEAAKWGEAVPDVIIRGHRHRCIEVAIPTEHVKAHVLITPGWQLKTPFSQRIAGARMSQPQFGGAVLHWSETHKELFVRTWVRSLKRGRVE